MDESGGSARARKSEGQPGAADAGRDEDTLKAVETLFERGWVRGQRRRFDLTDQTGNRIPVSLPDGVFQPVEDDVIIRCQNLRWDCCCCQ